MFEITVPLADDICLPDALKLAKLHAYLVHGVARLNPAINCHFFSERTDEEQLYLQDLWKPKSRHCCSKIMWLPREPSHMALAGLKPLARTGKRRRCGGCSPTGGGDALDTYDMPDFLIQLLIRSPV
jgi:hypothetical protein